MEQEDQKETEILKETVRKVTLDSSEVHFNVGQQYLITTTDKAKLCLKEYLTRLEDRKAWTIPFSLLLSVILTLLTTEFKDFILPKDTWKGVFMFALFFFLAWWAIEMIKLQKKPLTIDDIVDQLKKDSSNQR